MYCQHQLKPITSLERLHYNLQLAVELEFSTLPPYLCALYSIKENTNTTACQVIHSVVIQEMLHLTNAANLLIAVGGQPYINKPEFIPKFPTKLPDQEQWFTVNLLKFSPEALQTCLYIEEPGYLADGLITIGEFYENIQEGLDFLNSQSKVDLFPCNTKPQGGAKYYHGTDGAILNITDLQSAQFAINSIITEGEGRPNRNWDPEKPFPLKATTEIFDDAQLGKRPLELAHYYRFNELFLGKRYVNGDSHHSGPTGANIEIDYSAVYNMKPNPNSSDYDKHPELAAMNLTFNKYFTQLLDQLHNAFNGNPDCLNKAIDTMFKLKSSAQVLMSAPIPDSPNDYYAGPSWKYLG